MNEELVDDIIEDIIDSFKLALQSFSVPQEIIDESSLIVSEYYFNHYVL